MGHNSAEIARIQGFLPLAWFYPFYLTEIRAKHRDELFGHTPDKPNILQPTKTFRRDAVFPCAPNTDPLPQPVITLFVGSRDTAMTLALVILLQRSKAHIPIRGAFLCSYLADTVKRISRSGS